MLGMPALERMVSTLPLPRERVLLTRPPVLFIKVPIVFVRVGMVRLLVAAMELEGTAGFREVAELVTLIAIDDETGKNSASLQVDMARAE
jgi:hypothetical protein